jgi:hypothetical protein
VGGRVQSGSDLASPPGIASQRNLTLEP